MNFDAVSIEHAFAKLIGNSSGARGTSHDADVFRAGNSKNLAKALSDATNALEEKIKSVQYSTADMEPGGAKARIDAAIHQLRKITVSMTKISTVSREDYHWEIIGCLISTISALLETAKN